jgi:GWxTD domain-containing protein
MKKNNKLRQAKLFVVLSLVMTLFVFPDQSKLDPESEEFYKFARYLFTKNERKVFLNLPDKETRERFIKYFWEIRDPSPMTEENEFKIEMEERVDYVSKYLKEGPIPGWKTDRGRIYLLLGPPNSTYEKPFLSGEVGTQNIGIIYWYYEESAILVCFVDTRGHGIYRMDTRITSLRLLNELENRKYYISTKEDSTFETTLLNFDLTYDSKTKELLFSIDSKNILFEKTDSQTMAKFKIDLIIYKNEIDFSKKTEVITTNVDENKLLKEDSTIELRLPIDLPPGNVKIDAIVTDLFGNAVRREFKSIKVKI